MQRMHVDLRQLRHFVAVVEQRSFVAAAAVVNLSQPALSRSIQTLEQAAGHPLIDRASKDLLPTEQGRVVLEYAHRLLREANRLSDEVVRFNDVESGTLHFGAGPAPAAYVVPKAVARFIQRFPKARVDFMVDHWQELDRRLLAEEIAFFVADTRHFESNPAYQVIRLRQHRWRFYCRIGHPLDGVSNVSAAQLFRYPIATTFRPPGIHKALIALSGRPDFMPTIECEHTNALQQILLESDAIGITQDNFDHVLSDRFCFVDLRNADIDPVQEDMRTRYGIVSRASHPLSHLSSQYIALLQEVDQESPAFRQHRLRAIAI